MEETVHCDCYLTDDAKLDQNFFYYDKNNKASDDYSENNTKPRMAEF